MKKRLGLIAIVSLSALLSVSLLTRGHVWWDDFASYIMQAQSLLRGDTADFVKRNSFTILQSSYPVGPVAYPWGFPFLLAPALAVFGLNALAMKLVNTLTFALFLVSFHRLARLRLTRGWSLLLTALLAFNPALLLGHDYILSDIPFLLFSTLALLLIDLRRSSREPYWDQLILGLIIFAAYFIRTNGILLLAPLAVTQFEALQRDASMKNKWPRILLPHFVFILLFFTAYFLLPRGQESYFSHFSMFTLERFLGNVWYYLKLPLAMFDSIPAGAFFSILTLLLFMAGIAGKWRGNLHFIVYIILTLLLFMLWPETQGLRFIYPVLPLFALIAAQGALWLAERLSQPVITKIVFGIWLVLALLSFGVSAKSGWVNLQNDRVINGPFDPVSSEMFEFIRGKTPPDSVIIFFKPRAMRLFTDRDSFLTDRCQDLTQGDYVVIHEKQGSNGQLTQQALATCGIPAESVFNNKRFTVYKIPP